jgi:hypothetical protein
MKIKLLLITLLVTFFGYTQNGSVFGKTWFVYAISIAQNNQTLPKDPFIFPFAKLNFSSAGFVYSSNEVMKEDCEMGFTSHITYNGSSNSDFSFDFVDFTPINSIAGCLSKDVSMQNFMTDYIAFFENSQNETFHYFIQDVYGIDHLKILKDNGDYIWLCEFPYEYRFPPNEVSEGNWVLSKIVIDHTDIYVPDLTNAPFDKITVDFMDFINEAIYLENPVAEQTFTTSGCNSTQGIAEFYNEDNTFYIYSVSGTLSDCGFSEINNFYNQYLGIFTNHLPGTFTYEIVNESGNATLIITNNQGDKAVYSNEALAINEQTYSDIKIFPNPVNDWLSIRSSKQIKEISIYDSLGKEMLHTNNNQIDFSNIANGCYIISVLFNDDSKIFKKIVH